MHDASVPVFTYALQLSRFHVYGRVCVLFACLHCMPPFFPPFKTLPVLSDNRHTDIEHVDTYKLTHTHTYTPVRLWFNMLKCLFSARTFPDACVPCCHGEKVGVSIFASPFFGDNDGHFFFSVTDDRQN